MTCIDVPSGGYVIDYSTSPRAVSRWHGVFGVRPIITPLPDGIRRIYRDIPYDVPDAHVREFTTEQVAYLDFEALDYMYAAELYETIWEDIPGESPHCTK